MGGLVEALEGIPLGDCFSWDVARRSVAARIRAHLKRGDAERFASLALGQEDPNGNWSATSRGEGSRALAASPPKRILELGRRLSECDPADVPRVIREEAVPHVGLAIGSEIACCLRPRECWVYNRRTRFARFLVDLEGRWNEAEELFGVAEASRMEAGDPEVERVLYQETGLALRRLGEAAAEIAAREGLAPDDLDFLWADSVAAVVYEWREE